ncbi:hypothetical protein PHYBLDRAFT_153013 [Phycomyces blakesleeanus NRRL 1555(-)]|uniref:Uncharacterized protein n=1 Tax=Phycomyces blakesleeanus (strain ATCC 8743b / DSM 1359 / FGSC 10004 / NBRC 33097 / NRRL 1555) TaxID=763407 RepID=A0A162TCB4_PHYB8|nr:hypothetical protein PHYBLDRAFT_153013 [Phycomyces blakesleeanus NRRL 1555(-)]OAD65983.1 hypothetical protein PHYBLDRAFT_153013 [Phycomyces blakesleeanus NRRL 1555(-)]|eukprot:XP_018284023.1 hypothetical protein PHYBLDRAFT_153013 [Phycomyces blakesleeanus NRRL 1555(-)]
MNRFKGLHIKMRSVRFTKRASCRSVGPGAKPMRSEQKVNPEASGKLYGDTGIPRPFTVLFLGTVCVVIHVGSFDSKDWIIVSLWDRRHAPPVRLVLSLGLA